MTAGAPRKPSALKMIQGTDKPSRINPNEPKADPAMPAAPTWLSDEQRVHFEYFGRIVLNMRVLTEHDGPALALLAAEYQKYLECQAACDLEGHSITVMLSNGKETKRRNPHSSAMAEAWKNLTIFMRDFGLTPSSRHGVSAAPKSKPGDSRAKWRT